MAEAAATASPAASAETLASKGRITTVPEDAWDRIVVALWRSLDYMPAEAQTKLREALDLKTLRALAVVLGVWAGLTFTGLGTLATTLMTALGAITVAHDLYQLFVAGKDAAFAKTPEALELAAQHMATAVLGMGVDLLLGYLQSKLLASVKSAIETIRGSALRTRAFFSDFFESPGTRPGAPKGGAPEPTRPGAEPTKGRPAEAPPTPRRLPEPGVLTGVGFNQTVQAAASFPWLPTLGIGLGAVALTAAAAWLLRRPKLERPDAAGV